MHHQSFPFGRGWNISRLALSHLLALALLASWVFPTTQHLWQQADERIFYLLNGSLEDAGQWSYFWALMNVRSSDIVPMLVILLTLTFPLLGIKGLQLHKALIGFVLLIILMWPIRETLYIVAVNMDLSGDSPSRQLQPAYLLSEQFPHLGTKDQAGHSFPGDHSAVLWTWCGYLILMLRSRLAILTLPLAILFMLPRLVAGAHWFTDNVVGGAAVALITLGWAFYTPLLHYPTQWISKQLSPIFYYLGEKIPGLGLLPFFAQENTAKTKS